MEFFLFLNSNTQEIIQKVISLNYAIYENIELCNNSLVGGFVTHPLKKFVVCTNNIKRISNNISYSINATVTHEGMHVVHLCNNNKPINIEKKIFNEQTIKNLQTSLKYGNNTDYYKEIEASEIQENPQKVLHYLKKYCF